MSIKKILQLVDNEMAARVEMDEELIEQLTKEYTKAVEKGVGHVQDLDSKVTVINDASSFESALISIKIMNVKLELLSAVETRNARIKMHENLKNSYMSAFINTNTVN